MLDMAEGEQRALGPLTLRILSVNMAAIHTTSMVSKAARPTSVEYLLMYISATQAFTQALFDLTTHPEHLLPMREEAERVVREEGWTKAALNSMAKIDSFLRESQRINTNGPSIHRTLPVCADANQFCIVGMSRKVVAKEGFRFSNGIVLPNGAYVNVAAKPTHYDDGKYFYIQLQRTYS
jgi:hypothetical protein